MSPIPQHVHHDAPIERPLCVTCARPLSPCVAEKYTGRVPQCGGMVSTIHVGLVKGDITCRYQDPNDNPVSTWQRVELELKERAKVRKR